MSTKLYNSMKHEDESNQLSRDSRRTVGVIWENSMSNANTFRRRIILNTIQLKNLMLRVKNPNYH